MGYTRHHAIVVTGQNKWHAFDGHATIYDARQAAIDAGCKIVTEVAEVGTNGYTSFMVAPDGGKEYWTTSDEGDAARDRFIDWLRGGERRVFAWAEIELASDDGQARIARNRWENLDDE